MAKTFIERRTAKPLSAVLLQRYSEWLDADAQLMKKPKKKDKRTHEDLVAEFLAGEV